MATADELPVEQVAGQNINETSNEVVTADDLEVLQYPCFTQNLPERANPDTNSDGTSNEVAEKDKIQVDAVRKLGDGHVMVSTLGEGAFASVIKCLDTKTNEVVAIKLIKNKPETADLVRREIAILEKLQCLDPDTCNIVKWNGSFSYKNYTCLSFEILKNSLSDHLHSRRYKGLSTTELRPLIYQLATALHHLSSLEVLHGDIKPCNIMFVDPQPQPPELRILCGDIEPDKTRPVNPQQQSPQVKLIDFGLALPLSQIELGYVMGTPGYVAPEVLLQIPYNEAIDMWSLGIVVVELVTGHPLYRVGGVYDMLRSIIKTHGHLPRHMLERGMATEYFYNRRRNRRQRWTLKTPKEFRYETGDDTMDECVPSVRCLDDLEQLLAENGEGKRDRRLLLNLIKRMLHLDPDQRIKPQEVLQHPFIMQNLPQRSEVKKAGLFRCFRGLFQKKT